MGHVDKLRNDIINKLQNIRNADFLEALSRKLDEGLKPELTEEQVQLLLMGLDDIKHNRTIADDELNRRDREWLNGL